MLFVIGMMVLTQVILKATGTGLFQGLAGMSPLQRLSIYADDGVFFFRPEREREEAHAVKEVLNIFGQASGLHVNYQKTTATLIRVEGGDEQIITEVLGCDLASFPIRYLGTQLALRPLTKA
jgi:hypothetical protein